MQRVGQGAHIGNQDELSGHVASLSALQPPIAVAIRHQLDSISQLVAPGCHPSNSRPASRKPGVGVEEHEVPAVVELPARQGLDVFVHLQAAWQCQYVGRTVCWAHVGSTPMISLAGWDR